MFRVLFSSLRGNVGVCTSDAIETNRTMTTAAVIGEMVDATRTIEMAVMNNVLIHYVTMVVKHNDYYESI